MRFRPVLLLLIVPLMAGSISSAQETQPAYRKPETHGRGAGGGSATAHDARRKG